MYFVNNIKDYLKNFKQKLTIENQDLYKFLIITVLTIMFFAISIRYISSPAVVNFTHFFYIPIFLAGYWWNRKAIFYIIFIVLLRYFIYFDFFGYTLPTFFNFQSLSYLFIGIFAMLICEKKTNAEVGLKEINQNLERIIEEQTSELKHANQKLEESEVKYRDIFENSIYIMYIYNMYDSKGCFTELNMAGYQTLGYTKNEILGSHFQKFLTGESNEIREKSFAKLMSNDGFEYPITLEIICKNGEIKWLEVTERSIKNSNNIVEIHGIARDITEKIKLKKELNKSNKMRKLMCYLIEGDRGGRTRAIILKHLAEKPHNANQLANILSMDYKTIRHHLDVLIKNEIVAKRKNENYFIYYLSESVEANILDFIT